MTENVKMNFFKKVIISIKDLDKYDQLAVQTVKQGISYFLKLILLFATIVSIIYSMQVFKLMNTAKEQVGNIPDFEYKNGEIEFKQNEPVIIENITNVLNSILILPEADEKMEKEYISKVKTYNSYLILNKSDFSISVNDKKFQYKYKDIFDDYSVKSFNKKQVVDLIESIDPAPISISFFFVMTLSLFLGFAISIGVDIIITFLVSTLTSRLAKIRLKTSALINVSIHSLTLSIILYLLYYIVNILTGFEIRNFRIMYIAVSSIYACIAVLIIKVDFIERQQELAKVIKIQEEIRKECNEEEVKTQDELNNKDEENKEKGENDE